MSTYYDRIDTTTVGTNVTSSYHTYNDPLIDELSKMARKAETMAKIEQLAETNPHVKELYEELMFIVNLQSEHE